MVLPAEAGPFSVGGSLYQTGSLQLLAAFLCELLIYFISNTYTSFQLKKAFQIAFSIAMIKFAWILSSEQMVQSRRALNTVLIHNSQASETIQAMGQMKNVLLIIKSWYDWYTHRPTHMLIQQM